MTSRDPIRWMADASGARAVSFERDGFDVRISPSTADDNQAAHALAVRLSSEIATISDDRVRADRLVEINARLRARVEQLEVAAEAAVVGRRRFFGPVLVVPEAPGDWAGSVLLLDPEKKRRGQSLRFASLRELRREHPELWIVGQDADGVLLDACESAATTKAAS